MADTRPRLWTRDFTILTLGSAVTMLGHAVSGFAVSLLVLDYTGSVLLYSLYLIAYCLPQVVMPLAAGPWLDNFSRVRVIYGMDFLAAGLYLAMFLLLRGGYFSYMLFLALVLLLGAIDSVYLVAYDSLYPNLISEGNYARGYAVSTLLYPLAAIMTPVASWLYGKVGVAPLFLADFFFFFTAACFETQIRADERYLVGKKTAKSFSYMLSELKEGFRYIRGEKGLLTITSYFFFTFFCGAVASTLWLPYFRETPGLGVMMYTYVQGCNVAGRLAAGLVQYKVKYPARKKFLIAVIVYASICFLDGGLLYLPLAVMFPIAFFSGFLAANSYNIRLSTTQSYIPDAVRGRFNGGFQMITTGGNLLGQLLAGVLAGVFPIRGLVAAAMAVNLAACFLIILPRRHAVAEIYNRDV